MGIYQITLARQQQAVDEDLFTIIAHANRPIKILQCHLFGAEVTNSDNEAVLQYSTGGSGTTAVPVEPAGSSGTAGFLVYKTRSSQPSLSGNAPKWRFPFSGNGGASPFVALPGCELSIPAGGQMSLRAIRGTAYVVVDMQVEEVEG